MKEMLLSYARYNAWANGLLINALLQLPAGAEDAAVVSSFATIKATVCHTWAAEDMWLQRLCLVTQPHWKGASYEGTFAELCERWRQSSGELVAQVLSYEEQHLAEMLEYKDLRGNAYATPVWQIVQHLCNHATNHRGQLITLLRQAGITNIPTTDYIAYVRMK